MIIVVGGHSRNIGKTAVMCGIVEGLRGYDWTALKITQYGHGRCSKDGKPCTCADPRRPVCIDEQTQPDPANDTGRYLVAGAAKSYWVRTPRGRLAEAMPEIRRILAAAPYAIVESNSVLGFLRPDLTVMVLDGGIPDFRPSTKLFLDRADLLVQTSEAPLQWPGISAHLLAGKPIHKALAPRYRSELLISAISSVLVPPPTPAPQVQY